MFLNQAMIKTRKLLRTALIAALSASAIASASSQPRNAAKPIVILITIDGFPARALSDPHLPMPVLRALAAAGSSATAMKPINPTVTWPNHTAMVTGVDAGKHHVIANGLILPSVDGTSPQLDREATKDQLVHARTLYDAAADKGLTTGQVDWVAIMGAKNIKWSFAEKPDPDGEIAKDLIAQKIVTRDLIADFGGRNAAAYHDQLWTDAAVDIIKITPPTCCSFISSRPTAFSMNTAR